MEQQGVLHVCSVVYDSQKLRVGDGNDLENGVPAPDMPEDVLLGTDRRAVYAHDGVANPDGVQRRHRAVLRVTHERLRTCGP